MGDRNGAYAIQSLGSSSAHEANMVALQCNLIMFMVFTLSSALYNSNSDVIELTETNFNSKVLDSESIWIVEFYAPWCGHCQGLVPEYSKAATGLKGIVKVGGVDADVHKSLAAKYGIRGFPTIKVFGTDKNKPEDYQGPRTASGFVDAAFKVLRKKVDAQLGGGKKPESSGGKQGDESDVIELTDNNFEKLVLNSEDMWLVEFYAPWCGHCKNLAPHWASAATELKGKVKLGAVDATVHTVITSRHQVQGYPTIKYFPGGKKDGTVEDYSGGRTSGEIVQWALEKLAENISPPEVVEIISDDVLKGNCEDHQLCIISVLPHILDCQSDCRNAYLTVLRKLGEKFKKNMWGWLWVEAGAQTDLEASFEIGGFGYPAMAALNTRKMKCSILKGSFSFEGINDFLRELAYGRGSTFPVKGSALPKISSATPWDGKDGHLDIVEDYDLSDVELDDLDSAKDEL